MPEKFDQTRRDGLIAAIRNRSNTLSDNLELLEAFTEYNQIGEARRSCFSSLNPDRKYLLSDIDGLDQASIKSQLDTLYSMNSLLGYRYQPGGELNPLVTYAQAVLDQPITSYNHHFEDYALTRAKDLLRKCSHKNFSREEISELARVSDRIGVWNKVVNYGIFEDTFQTYSTIRKLSDVRRAGLMPEGLNWFEQLFGTPYAVLRMHEIAQKQFGFLERLSARLFSYVLKLFAMTIGQPYRTIFRNSWLDPSSINYFPATKTQIVSSGCGMSTAVQPMSEDPSNYFSDLDVYLKTLEYSHWYSPVFGAKYLSKFLIDTELTGVQTAINAALFLIGFCFLMVFVSYKRITNISVIFIVEIFSILLVYIAAVGSLLWYNPVGLCTALVLLVLFICEFCLLLAVLIRNVRN